MPLSVNNTIVTADIEHITMFKNMKVWRLEGSANDQIVIKIDHPQAPQIKAANIIIKAVDPRAKLKILTTAERQAIKQFVDDFENLVTYYQALGVTYGADQAAAIASLKQSLTFTEPFVKMEALNLRDLEGALTVRMTGDKTDLRSFAATLIAPGGLETLGAIVAADMYNGNKDRFYPGSHGTRTIGTVALNLRCLVNVGNVFKINTGTGSALGALDFVDPQSRFKDPNIPLAQAEAAAGEKWPGRYLSEKWRRQAFAKDIVHDLEAILSPKKSRFSLKSKLPSDAASRIEKGMVQGAKQIAAKLEQKYNPNGWNQGLRDRYMIISQVK